MANDDSLGDRLRIGSADEVAREFHLLADRFEQAVEWITDSHPRTDKSVAFNNLLTGFATHLRIAGDNVETHISILAVATRNLYELNRRVRDIVQSDEALRIWSSEVIADKIEVLEGILELQTRGDMAAERGVLQNEIDRLESLRKKHDLLAVKPEAVGKIARRLGLSDEHRAIFKLLSKLVHPSSYLVNDPKNAASDEVRLVLQAHAQLYAWDAFERVGEALSMPSPVREKIRSSEK